MVHSRLMCKQRLSAERLGVCFLVLFLLQVPDGLGLAPRKRMERLQP